MEKPFALFIGSVYYPSPGWGDFEAVFTTKEEATKAGEEKSSGEYQWWQVVDLRTLQIVAHLSRKF